MSMDLNLLNRSERISLQLRGCYQSYGYTQYKMRKFEEYDLYAKNKDFLVSDNVITFNDRSGRLMALKPDVTLSIVRSGRDEPGVLQKVYYTENVYRVTKGADGFREIMQAGLECIGAVDSYQISEVLTLACRSLQCIREQSVLYVSHLGIVSRMVEALGLDETARQQVLRCIGSKNLHELTAICEEKNADRQKLAALQQLLLLHGSARDVLPELLKLDCDREEVQSLQTILSNLEAADCAERVKIDFSIVSDLAYYNGIVFQGYVDGVPVSVLSGGQYDRLMERMGRHSRAIGFAVYLDTLERLEDETPQFDTDLVLLYEADADGAALCAAMKELTEKGYRVTALKTLPEKLQYRYLAKLRGSEVEILGEHA